MTLLDTCKKSANWLDVTSEDLQEAGLYTDASGLKKEIYDRLHWQSILIKTGDKDTDLCVHGYRINVSNFTDQQVKDLETALDTAKIAFNKKKATRNDIVVESGIDPVPVNSSTISVEDPLAVARLKYGAWTSTMMPRRMHQPAIFKHLGIVTTVAQAKKEGLLPKAQVITKPQNQL